MAFILFTPMLGSARAFIAKRGLMKIGYACVSTNGKLQFHMFWGLAEFERTLISERTKAGLEAAKAAGPHRG